MYSRRQLQYRMRRLGMMVVVLAVLLQTFAVAHMPAANPSTDGGMVVLCTSSGIKTVPLAQFLGIESDQNLEQETPGAMPSDGTCVLCLSAHNIAIAPSLNFLCATDLNAHATPTLPIDAPVSSRIWGVKQARAPPFNV